ncbi:MAG: hypothetical protein ACYCW6_00240 [Candidatus Xenobia bacterium]
MTESQRQILLHALGADSENPGFRNHFVADPGGPDWEDLMALVEAGLMRQRSYPLNEVGRSYCFHVTSAGQDLVGIRYR